MVFPVLYALAAFVAYIFVVKRFANDICIPVGQLLHVFERLGDVRFLHVNVF